jgi:ABC-type polysaccharide/polyol phosphate transport system ATPase subunit
MNDLTGAENAILSGMLMGNSRQSMMERLPEIAAFSELGKWMDQPITTYSSGMKARLGFSTAVNTDADIILVDEILSVGDAVFRKKSQKKMREMLGSDRTIIFVSHNVNSVKEVADRAVWIEAGKSVICGEPEKVCERYISFMEGGAAPDTGDFSNEAPEPLKALSL